MFDRLHFHNHKATINLVLAIILAAVGFLSGPFSGPARADHTVIQEDVVTIRNCKVKTTVLDASRGYPVILVIMSCSDNSPPTILLYTRPIKSLTAPQGSPQGWGMPSDLDWMIRKLELDIPDGVNDLHAYALRVLGATGSNDYISVDVVFDYGDQQMLKTFEQSLNPAGYPIGSSTVKTTPVSWPEGSGPSHIGVNSDGPFLTGWAQDGLYYASAPFLSPLKLMGRDEADWPFGNDPPLDVGTYGDDDIPFVVTLGSEDVRTFLIRDTPGKVSQPLPQGQTVNGESQIAAGQGGENPSTAVVPGEGLLIHYPDLQNFIDPEVYLTEICLGLPYYKKRVQFIVDKNTTYMVQECGPSGYYLITVIKHHPSNNTNDYGHVLIKGIQGSLESASLDKDGSLHITTVQSGSDADGNIIDTYGWVKVTIDKDSIIWGD